MKKALPVIIVLSILIVIVLVILAFVLFKKPRSNVYEKYEYSDKYIAGSTVYDAKNVKYVHIDWLNGQVDISRAEDEINVEENSDGLPYEEKVHSFLSGDTLMIRFCESGLDRKINQRYKNLKLTLPEGVTLIVDSVSANVNFDLLTCEKVNVSSVSGKITANTISTPSFGAKTVSGDVHADIVSGCTLFGVETVSGYISVGRCESGHIGIKSTSGKTKLGVVGCRDCNVETESGNTELEFPDGLGATVVFNTVGGSFSSTRRYESKNGYIFGDGECNVEVSTVSGNLVIN